MSKNKQSIIIIGTNIKKLEEVTRCDIIKEHRFNKNGENIKAINNTFPLFYYNLDQKKQKQLKILKYKRAPNYTGGQTITNLNNNNTNKKKLNKNYNNKQKDLISDYTVGLSVRCIICNYDIFYAVTHLEKKLKSHGFEIKDKTNINFNNSSNFLNKNLYITPKCRECLDIRLTRDQV